MTEIGPFTRADLADMGIGRRELAELLDQGRLTRIDRGWYSNHKSPSAAVSAVRIGGRLGRLSACKVHKLWVPPQPDLHVMLDPGDRRPTGAVSGVQFHRLAAACPTAEAPLDQSVAHVLHRHDLETGLVVLESAVNGGHMSESEARLRLFFQRRRVPVQPQAFIARIGRVDLLVGRSWIIEADSAAHHSASKDVARDRERDLHAREFGYVRDRLSFEQIWHTWERTCLRLQAVLRTGRHLQAPVPLR